MTPNVLPPLPVAIPLATAALLAAVGKHVPRRVVDVLAILATLASTAACVALALASRENPLVYWFGGWYPRGSIAVGISFVIDPVGAGVGVLSGVLTLFAFVFSLKYFDARGGLFHALMLAFLAALCGFGLTGDVFNLFVFFELMSAAALALCGYKSEEAGPVQGALNFGVLNTVGAFLVLAGIALLYGRTGALNMAQISRGLGSSHDGLVLVAFTFMTCGFLVKGAAAPFHFWLADAHAVAPTPVCILFSGVMVEAGLYAVARLYGAIFVGPLGSHDVQLRALFIGMGTLTAVVGGLLCFAQRHLKRMLAFSTIGHMGLLILGFGLLTPQGWAGAALYVVGHGMVKAALFLCAGVLLHRFRTVDELALWRRGMGKRALGVLMALGGLGLAGLPPFGTFLGSGVIEEAAEHAGYGGLVRVVVAFVSVLTGGAVLRATGRIFLGLGWPEEEVPGVGGETTESPETPPARIPWSMWSAIVGLLVLGAVAGLAPGLRADAESLTGRMLDAPGYSARVIEGRSLPPATVETEEPIAKPVFHGVATALAAVLLAGLTLLRGGIPQRLRAAVGPGFQRGMVAFRALHSGHVGDYVTWLTLGVAGFGGLCAVLLR